MTWSALLAFLWQDAPPFPARPVVYPNFNVLRLGMAAEVALSHVYAAQGLDWWAPFMAVPAFLAISGFVVLQSYAFTGSWRQFIAKRALRILPALIVSMVLTYTLFDWQFLRNSIITYLTGGRVEVYPSNQPLWSLAWEELAYGGLALLWLAGGYRKPAVLWGLLVLSAVIAANARSLGPSIAIILFLGPAFLIGNLVFLYRERLAAVHPAIPWAFFYLVMQYRFGPDSSLFNGVGLAIAQAFAVVWAGMAGLSPIRFKFPDISYGVYVYHMPILAFLYTRFDHPATVTIAALLAAVLIPFALMSWYFVEKPALGLKRYLPARAAL